MAYPWNPPTIHQADLAVKLIWAPTAWEDYLYWQQQDRKVIRRINALISECRRTPFQGTGRPEPLRGRLSGWWSRRITQEHRLVYRITGKDKSQALEILQCRYHY